MPELRKYETCWTRRGTALRHYWTHPAFSPGYRPHSTPHRRAEVGERQAFLAAIAAAP